MDWKEQIARNCSVFEVGGFRPTNDLTGSCFGGIRACLPGEKWPSFDGKPLWPVCQLNLRNAPSVPGNLRDIALLCLYFAPDYSSADYSIVDCSNPDASGIFFVRAYSSLDGLIPVANPDHGCPFKMFESRWAELPRIDYPTHHTLPIEFDALGIGDYYDQEGVEQVDATKIGGWPSCIQSEPWWDYRSEGAEFEFALQIASEEKAHCYWGDSGFLYLARSKVSPSVWAVDGQCY